MILSAAYNIVRAGFVGAGPGAKFGRKPALNGQTSNLQFLFRSRAVAVIYALFEARLPGASAVPGEAGPGGPAPGPADLPGRKEIMLLQAARVRPRTEPDFVNVSG